ncbi:hypothetical protein H6G27_35040 [Nostoc linckia FACHB-104]|nr:hypothetical protein [Nostoc linckia FACHB-104]
MRRLLLTETLRERQRHSFSCRRGCALSEAMPLALRLERRRSVTRRADE